MSSDPRFIIVMESIVEIPSQPWSVGPRDELKVTLSGGIEEWT